MSHAIVAERLVKHFGQTKALDGVDLTLESGTVLGVLGPNGAGKTTAVRILATLLRPDGGSARVGGLDVIKDAHKVRALVGLTGQYASVDEALTGSENLRLIGRLLGMSRGDSRARAAELLASFHLEDAADRAAKTYSGGMRRRLDLAASLIGRPKVLFLDEPTTGLDPRARNEVWEIVRELVSDGTSVLLTTQYLDEADQLANRISVIDHGKVIAHGTPDELKRQTGSQALAVRPVQESDVDKVLAVVSEVADGPELANGTVTARVTDPAVLPLVVRRLDDAGVAVAELALRTSTLDEVFLALTGHRAEEEAKA